MGQHNKTHNARGDRRLYGRTEASDEKVDHFDQLSKKVYFSLKMDGPEIPVAAYLL